MNVIEDGNIKKATPHQIDKVLKNVQEDIIFHIKYGTIENTLTDLPLQNMALLPAKKFLVDAADQLCSLWPDISNMIIFDYSHVMISSGKTILLEELTPDHDFNLSLLLDKKDHHKYIIANGVRSEIIKYNKTKNEKHVFFGNFYNLLSSTMTNLNLL